MKILLKHAVPSLLLICIAGCSSKKDDPVISTAPYIGEWESDCLLPQQAPIPAYLTYSFNIDTTEFEFILSSYFDENCTTQTPNTEQAGSRRGTITVVGTYVDGGIATSTDGLESNILQSTITSVTSTLESSEENQNLSNGTEYDFLVYVNDADVLFIEAELMGLTETPGSLALTLPLSRIQ